MQVKLSCLNSIAPPPLNWHMWCPGKDAKVIGWIDKSGSAHRQITLRPQKNMTSTMAMWWITTHVLGLMPPVVNFQGNVSNAGGLAPCIRKACLPGCAPPTCLAAPCAAFLTLTTPHLVLPPELLLLPPVAPSGPRGVRLVHGPCRAHHPARPAHLLPHPRALPQPLGLEVVAPLRDQRLVLCVGRHQQPHEEPLRHHHAPHRLPGEWRGHANPRVSRTSLCMRMRLAHAPCQRTRASLSSSCVRACARRHGR